jgi:hypothetical protein
LSPAIPVAVTVVPLWLTFALYALPATTVWPAVNDQVIVQVLIAYEALFVTVTVAPKSGGLLDGVCHATVNAPLQDAPVSAGAGLAVTTAAVTAVAPPSTTAMTALRKRC